MILTPQTRISELLETYDFMLDHLSNLSPTFRLLANPLARSTIGKVATLSQAASIAGMGVEELIESIAGAIRDATGTDAASCCEPTGEEPLTDSKARRELLKEIIRGLHDGGDPGEAKRRFAQMVKDVDAGEIAAMEQQLIEEGIPSEEVKKLCDVHVQVFREAIDVKDVPRVPHGHPVHTFMLENRALEVLLTQIDSLEPLSTLTDTAPLESLLESLAQVHRHYLRKENQLFPLLEKHGVTAPTQVMWSLDDDIRSLIKRCRAHLREGDPAQCASLLTRTVQALHDMIYKEERILFPMAVQTLSSQEWEQVRSGEAAIGYAWIPSVAVDVPEAGAPVSDGGAQGNALPLDTGTLSPEQINLMLTHLPVDISFVDEHDEVRYYSEGPQRIFPRSPGVIGRKVQNCHPPKSMGRVQEILDAFREGQRDTAAFWIPMEHQFIHIRYFAMRDHAGTYRGCLEVSQDVTDIRALTGECRLLE